MTVEGILSLLVVTRTSDGQVGIGRGGLLTFVETLLLDFQDEFNVPRGLDLPGQIRVGMVVRTDRFSK